MHLNESENAEVVDLSEIPLDYDAIQYDVKATKPEITLYFDKSGTISDVDTIEIQVLASSALPKKVYIGVEYDPVEYDTKFSLDSLTDDVYEIEETDSGYSLTTDNLDGLIDLGFSATFERGIIWPFDNSSVHDQLNKALGRIKSFEGKIIYYVTGQIPGAIQKKNPIPGIELTDGFKAAQKEWLKDASAKQEIRRVRQGRNDLEMLIDAIKQYPNVEKVQTINKKAGRDYTKEVMIIATVNKWNSRLKKRVPERTIMILRSNDTGKHLYAYNKAQAFNGYEARSWELMNKWLKNALQIAYTKDETEVNDDWGKDIDSAEAASLGIEESTKSKKKGMNLYEAIRILKKKGLKLMHESYKFEPKYEWLVDIINSFLYYECDIHWKSGDLSRTIFKESGSNWKVSTNLPDDTKIVFVIDIEGHILGGVYDGEPAFTRDELKQLVNGL